MGSVRLLIYSPSLFHQTTLTFLLAYKHSFIIYQVSNKNKLGRNRIKSLSISWRDALISTTIFASEKYTVYLINTFRYDAHTNRFYYFTKHRLILRVGLLSVTFGIAR